ncbi:hypothetical protein LJC36_06260 [Desulfovibrio sp. OttesenSCG-928-C14]|nr:hypothetical protein [Desulfovibrio sp. OttesenSCG-928-C14]
MAMKSRQIRIFAFGLMLLALAAAGCAQNSGGSYNSSGNDVVATPVSEYYYADFDDIPIPVEMQPTKDGYAVFTPGNIRLGMRTFEGRVEITSLNEAMSRYMERDGWTIYSGLSGNKQAVRVFNKDQRLCIILTTDEPMYTRMQVHVTQKL